MSSICLGKALRICVQLVMLRTQDAKNKRDRFENKAAKFSNATDLLNAHMFRDDKGNIKLRQHDGSRMPSKVHHSSRNGIGGSRPEDSLICKEGVVVAGREAHVAQEGGVVVSDGVCRECLINHDINLKGSQAISDPSS